MATKVDYEDMESVQSYADNETHKESKNKWLEKESEIISKFDDEFDRMDTKRKEYEWDWGTCDWQLEANTYYDEQGRLIVNPPLEQSLVELGTGRMAGKLTYNLESVGKKDIAQDTIVAKATLAHYINVEETHEKISQARNLAAWYWTAVYFTGVITHCNNMYKLKDETDVDTKNILRSQDYDEYKEYTYEFTGKNVPLREFWIDENAIQQPNLQEAEKCIMKETMSLEKFKLEYWHDDIFRGVDEIDEWESDVDPAYWEDKNTIEEEVIIHKYFNKTTKDFWIIANRRKVLFAGKMFNKNWELPFVSKQHYTNYKSFYWIGICHKVRYLKAYKAELLQDLLDQSKQWGMNIIAGNNEKTDDQWFNSPSEINIMRFSGDVGNIKPFSYEPNIAKYQTILDVIDSMVIQDTGENLKGTYTPVANQLGTVEIIENSRMTRLATVDANDDRFIGKILTHSLDNITQFAYQMQTKTVKADDDDIETVEYPTIKVNNAKVEEEDWKVTIIHDHWEDWYFEFREWMITWRHLVKVVTNSNTNTQKTLAKNSITQFVSNYVQLVQMNPELLKKEDTEWILQLMKRLYWYDDQFDVDTLRDKNKKENTRLLQQIQESLGLSDNLWNNDQQNQETNSGQITIPPQPKETMAQNQMSQAGTLQGGRGVPNSQWTNRWTLI